MKSLLALAAALAAGAAFAAPCGKGLDSKLRQQVESGAITVAWTPRPAPIPVDRHLQLEIAVCGAPVTALRLDADMPAHRHGMNYRATVQATGGGRYRAEGLLFHMPGRWRLIFDVDSGGQTLRLTQEIEVR